MKASDVALQLIRSLPSFTDDFGSSLPITSLSYAGGIVTGVTALPHGLSNGSAIVITGALTPNPITSLTRVGDVAFATTTNNHDLTEGYPNGEFTTVTIQGALNADYNGVHTLLSVPNRRNFTYEVLGAPPTPDLGAPELLENYLFGYNGMFLVTVIDDFTFTYPLPYAVGSPAQGDIFVFFKPRVTPCVSYDRAVEMYSQKNTDEYWAFVVLEDTTVSKDREILTDAPQTFNSGVDYRIREINGFSVFVFAAATDFLSAAQIRDTMEDIRIYLYKCLLGYKFNSGLVLDFEHNGLTMTYTTGHSRVEYNKAYYVHQFRFESVADITYADTVGPDANVAFRDIDLNIYNSLAQVIMDTPIDLDEVPL